MAGSSKFAAGKYANASCDRCGVRCKYRELRGETYRGHPTGVLVCPTCYDPEHEQNFLPNYVTVDPQALKDARPDTGLQASRQLYPSANWPPYPSQRQWRFRADEED